MADEDVTQLTAQTAANTVDTDELYIAGAGATADRKMTALEAKKLFKQGVPPWASAVPTLENTGLLKDNFEFFDDFTGSIINNLPVNWATISEDANVTVQYNQADPHAGVLDISCTNTVGGATLSLPRCVILNGSRDFYIECRANIEDEDDQDFYIGIREGGTLTNPEDAWDSSSGSFMAFGIADGDATPHLTYRDSGGTIQFDDSSVDITEGTWHTFGLYFDASGPSLTAYLDGVLVATASVTVDLDVGLLGAPFVGTRNGSSAAHNTLLDYYGLVTPRA